MLICNIFLLSFTAGYIGGACSYLLYINLCNTEEQLNEMKPMDMGPIKIEEMER